MINWAVEHSHVVRKLTNLKALAATILAVLFVVEYRAVPRLDRQAGPNNLAELAVPPV